MFIVNVQISNITKQKSPDENCLFKKVVRKKTVVSNPKFCFRNVSANYLISRQNP